MTSEHSPALRMTLLIWAIGAIVPLVMIFRAVFGEYDFAALWIAGKQAISGDAASIYDGATASIYADRFTNGISPEFPYPPHALIFFIPAALLPYIPAYFAWNFISGAFFWWASRPYLPSGFPSALAILSPAALLCFDFGQTSLLLGGLWLLAFRGRWWAVALLTFKPHLGVLSALSLPNRKAVVKTTLVAGVLIASSAVIFGPALWAAFFDHTLHHGAGMGARGRWYFSGVAPAMAFGVLGWIPFAVAGSILLVRRINAFTAATASLLISPFGFHYDMPVACLGLGILLYSNLRTMPLKHSLPLALAFIAPAIAIAGAWWVPPILLWALSVQVRYETGAFDGRIIALPAER